jgi:hypothetical protein
MNPGINFYKSAAKILIGGKSSSAGHRELWEGFEQASRGARLGFAKTDLSTRNGSEVME